MELVDSRLGPDVNENEIMLTIEIALLCTSISPAVRPNMSTVVSMLEGRVEDQKSILDSSAWSASVKEISDEQYLLSTFDESQPQSTSSDLPFTASSTSASDLYPISLETGFLDDES